MALAELKLVSLEAISDERGWLVEVLRGDKINLNPRGQIYAFSVNPGCSRGNHYHKRKTEWFFVIRGRGELRVQDVFTGQALEITTDETKPLLIQVPPLVAHAWINKSQAPLAVVAFIDEVFDPKDSDTFSFTLSLSNSRGGE